MAQFPFRPLPYQGEHLDLGKDGKEGDEKWASTLFHKDATGHSQHLGKFLVGKTKYG